MIVSQAIGGIESIDGKVAINSQVNNSRKCY